MPVSMRMVPGGMMSTSSVINGRCCPLTIDAQANRQTISTSFPELCSKGFIWLRIVTIGMYWVNDDVPKLKEQRMIHQITRTASRPFCEHAVRKL